MWKEEERLFSMIAVGIDVGGTSIKGATINDEGAVLHRFSMPMDNKATPDVVIGELCGLVNQTLAENKYSEKYDKIREEVKKLALKFPVPAI